MGDTPRYQISTVSERVSTKVRDHMHHGGNCSSCTIHKEYNNTNKGSTLHCQIQESYYAEGRGHGADIAEEQISAALPST